MERQVTMIERVARAIARVQSGALFREECTTTQLEGFGYMDAARAAIEAMRKPTDAMEVAGRDANPSGPFIYSDYIWDAMVDAALKEHEGEKG